MQSTTISKTIFVSLLIISIISFTSLIFPAILVEITTGDPYRQVNLFEIGILFYPIIISNLIFFTMFGLYKTKRLPTKFLNLLSKIVERDISKRTSTIIIIVLFLVYLSFTIDEFKHEEYELGDYNVVQRQIDAGPESYLYGSFAIRYTLLSASIEIFDNIKIIPFFASVSLLLITYFITLEITKKRLSGLVAFAVLMQSNLFLLFDTTATYENFWTAFYFLSLYLIWKKPFVSPIAFVLGLFSKPLVIMLLPINFYCILASKSLGSRKKYMLIVYGVLTSLIIGMLLVNPDYSEQLGFDGVKLVSGFNEFGNSLRFDSLILVLFFPMIILLFYQISKQQNNVSILFVGIIFALISQPLFHSIIGMTAQPYRYIPFITFCAIGIGMLFTNFKTVDQK